MDAETVRLVLEGLAPILSTALARQVGRWAQRRTWRRGSMW